MDAIIAPGTTELWIRRFHEADDASIALVCFPHAGGAASYYFSLSRAVTPLIDVRSVQYPGRQDRRREPLIGTISALADEVTEHVLAALGPWDRRPVAFFGHSMGAVVAFEVADRLRRRGAELTHLFVSARGAPDCHQPEGVHTRDDAGLLAELSRLGGTGGVVLDDAEMRRLLLPVVRADYQAIETYRYLPRPPLNCPVTAMTGDRDPKVTRDCVRAWSAHTAAAFDCRQFPGGHFYLAENFACVVEAIRAALRAGHDQAGSGP
jgi:surfactin synthase thioesterase subunit